MSRVGLGSHTRQPRFRWRLGQLIAVAALTLLVGSGIGTGTVATAAVQSTPRVAAITPASGPAAGGTRVTITGTNLTGTTDVRFGSNAASKVVVNGSTSVTVTAPSGTGSANVRVTTPAGTSAETAADVFTYAPLPPASGSKTAAAAPAPTPGAADPTIVVNAGGVRSGNTTTINPLPDGAIFTATGVSNGSTRTCTTSGGTGTCTISVPAPPNQQWDVTETSPPSGWYLNSQLDAGSSSAVNPFPYTFRTTTLNGNETVNVPGSGTTNTSNNSNSCGTGTACVFSSQLATSLNDPPAVEECGLNIALVLDQSGSMAQNNKQTTLIAAANDTITALTGTPSTVAIYTFSSNTGKSIGSTSTITAASAAPLHNFINTLPAPSGATNWDEGLAQVPAATTRSSS
jgi:IPT/TIG domain/von Willebrand factor type A domain